MVNRKSPGRTRKRSGGRIFLILLLLLLLAAGGAAWLVLVPFGPSRETFVEITPGSSSFLIGYQLQAAGIVRNRFAFDLLRFWKPGTLKAGEYRFDHPVPMTEVYRRIQRGDVYTIEVTIPEGATIFDIATRLDQAGLCTAHEFLDAQAHNIDLIQDIDPGAKSLEGYLFPDTYRFPRKAGPVVIVTAMVKRFRSVAAEIGLQQDFHQTVTMASLVERETAIDGERPLVASVFFNRLEKNMPLATDPSVIYGLEVSGQWRGQIYESDLKRDTPYNTYLHAGLPPGPVANPGVKALRAAMQPAQTDYLYFVAAGTDAQGKSMFASTLEEHNRNVADYRNAVKKAGAR